VLLKPSYLKKGGRDGINLSDHFGYSYPRYIEENLSRHQMIGYACADLPLNYFNSNHSPNLKNG
jgi:hypothetical protein